MKNGDLVRDKITGLQGVAISRTEYLNGCVRFCVQPTELFEGKPIESHYFDEEQLEVLQDTPYNRAKLQKTGGDRPAPRDRSNPK